MGEIASEEQVLDTLPEWVPDYLAAWGSKVGPDGERMQVNKAAALVGITPDAVRMLRARSEQFKLLEYVARHSGGAFAASFMEAGIKGMVFDIFRSFRTLVQNQNPQVVLQAMKWAMDRPDVEVVGQLFDLDAWKQARQERLSDLDELEVYGDEPEAES